VTDVTTGTSFLALRTVHSRYCDADSAGWVPSCADDSRYAALSIPWIGHLFSWPTFHASKVRASGADWLSATGLYPPQDIMFCVACTVQSCDS
jgi:hypothetical protein